MTSLRILLAGAAIACMASSFATPLQAQAVLNLTTPPGTVGRIPPVPFVPGCQNTPEPYYFSIRGTINALPAPNEEIRLLVRPILLDGSTIPGCEWVTQCQRGFVLPDNSFLVIGQFGTNSVPRTWFAGMRADVQFALVDRTAGVPVCIANPAAVSLAVSNVVRVNVDPGIPTLFDFDGPCGNSSMNVSGTPVIGNTLTFALPSSGAVAIGVASTAGFPLSGCRVFFNAAAPIIPVNTDPAGLLNLPIPLDMALVGADFGSQGVQLTAGALDLTQPTLVSIR